MAYESPFVCYQRHLCLTDSNAIWIMCPCFFGPFLKIISCNCCPSTWPSIWWPSIWWPSAFLMCPWHQRMIRISASSSVSPSSSSSLFEYGNQNRISIYAWFDIFQNNVARIYVCHQHRTCFQCWMPVTPSHVYSSHGCCHHHRSIMHCH